MRAAQSINVFAFGALSLAVVGLASEALAGEAPGREVSAATGSAVIDGALSAGEWEGATRASLGDDGEVLLLADEDYFYLGIRGPSEGVGSICVQKEKEVLVLHASLALVQTVFRPGPEGWEKEEPLDWCCRDGTEAPAAQEERESFLASQGWLASTATRGTANEMEFQIARSFGQTEGLKIALGYLSQSPRKPTPRSELPPPLRWPATAGDSCTELSLVMGRPGEDVSFQPEDWSVLVPAGP